MSGGPATPAPYEGGRHVPNILTVSRLLLAAAFFVVLSPWQYEKSPAAAGTGIDWWILFAAALFGLAAITDALDGMLARRWGVVSVFGRIMDPFADKILILGAFILLAGRGFMMSIDQKAPIPMSAVTPWMVTSTFVVPAAPAIFMPREKVPTPAGPLSVKSLRMRSEFSGRLSA